MPNYLNTGIKRRISLSSKKCSHAANPGECIFMLTQTPGFTCALHSSRTNRNIDFINRTPSVVSNHAEKKTIFMQTSYSALVHNFLWQATLQLWFCEYGTDEACIDETEVFLFACDRFFMCLQGIVKIEGNWRLWHVVFLLQFVHFPAYKKTGSCCCLFQPAFMPTNLLHQWRLSLNGKELRVLVGAGHLID